jgi:hypothetical protein
MKPRLHAALYEDGQALLEAVRETRSAGFEVDDVFTPYPIHGMEHELGLRRSRLAVVGFIAGLAGLVLALALQWWTSAIDWPLNVGGKPFNSFPVFIPVAFELTVLFSGFISLGILLLRTRLWPGSRRRTLPRVTDDRFGLVLVERDASFDAATAHEILLRNGAIEILESEDLL